MAYHQYEKSRIFFGKMSDLKGYRFKILQRKLVKETGTQEWKLTTQLWLLHKVGKLYKFLMIFGADVLQSS